MKNYLLIIVLLSITSMVFGQKIEIKSNGLFVNSHKITKNTTPVYLESILGKPDRKLLKKNTIWTYDKLGVIVFFNPTSLSFKSIEVDFRKENYDFSAKQTFSGEFLLYGFYISKNTPIVSLKKMKELVFTDTPYPVYQATTSNIDIIFQYLKNPEDLEVIGFSFKD